MFDVLIVKPIFNLLVLVYGLLPGHNFGLALIIFTVLTRFLMWPLVKKQLHHAKAMRALQPELKRIKKETKGDRQKESLMTMALYKEREVSPFGSIGVLIIQLIILLGLYSGLRRLIDNPSAIIDFSYSWVRELGWLKELARDIKQFDATLLGVVDLTKAALPSGGGIYWPAMLIVIGSSITQYFQSKQLMPQDKDARTLRQLMREASSGKQADSSEINAAVGRSTRFFIPALIFIFTIGLPSALGLYWLVSGLVAYLQQGRVLKQDETELGALANKNGTNQSIIEGEVIESKKTKNTPKKKSATKKRRKR